MDRNSFTRAHFIARIWDWQSNPTLIFPPAAPDDRPPGQQIQPDAALMARLYMRHDLIAPWITFSFSTIILNQTARPTLPTIRNTVSIHSLISASMSVSIPDYSSTVSIPVNVVDVSFPMSTNSPQSRLNRDGLYSA